MEKSTVNKKCKTLLIGGSAGSLEVLMAILPELKPIITFSIVIILHRKSAENNVLENLIAMKTTIPVAEVEDKTVLKPGCIYIAPSDYHILFEKNNEIALDVSEKVNYSRPSIDVAFESAALAFGSNCTALLLSGANADGTEGLKTIKKYGGKVLIQNPENAKMPYMLQSVLSQMTPDHIMDIPEILIYINSID